MFYKFLRFFILILTSFLISADICNHCKNRINENNWIIYDNNDYHNQCFACSYCNYPVPADEEIYDYGIGNNLNIYHEQCYPNDDLCTSCSFRQGYFNLYDGRKQCQACSKRVVFSEDIDTQSQIVIKLLEEYSFSDFYHSVNSVEIFDSKAMKWKLGFFNPIEPGGLCVPDIEYKTPLQNFFQIGEIENITCDIYILDYLHELDFRATLAHEYIHAWMMIHDVYDYYYSEYGLSFTEGVAELGAYLVYLTDRSYFAENSLYHHINNEDPIYGDGYRKIKKCLDKYGWENLTEKILNKDSFPCFESN